MFTPNRGYPSCTGASGLQQHQSATTLRVGLQEATRGLGGHGRIRHTVFELRE